MLKRALKYAIRLLPPQRRLPVLARRALNEQADLAEAARLCQADKGAIDVGANAGLFSWVFAQRAAWCVAFEPNADLATALARALPQIRVHALGLSDSAGNQQLETPVIDGVLYTGYASMARSGALGEHPHVTVSVPVRTLDSFALRNVGLIKIDVEGFEERALHGAAATIQSERPVLLIEIEERHNPGGFDRISALLRKWGYGAATAVAGADNNYVFRHTDS